MGSSPGVSTAWLVCSFTQESCCKSCSPAVPPCSGRHVPPTGPSVNCRLLPLCACLPPGVIIRRCAAGAAAVLHPLPSASAALPAPLAAGTARRLPSPNCYTGCNCRCRTHRFQLASTDSHCTNQLLPAPTCRAQVCLYGHFIKNATYQTSNWHLLTSSANPLCRP